MSGVPPSGVTRLFGTQNTGTTLPAAGGTTKTSLISFNMPWPERYDPPHLFPLGTVADVSKQHTSALPGLRNDTIAQVIVGEEEASFYVHRNVICESSSFFKAALNGTFKESAEGKVILPEDDPDTFERFLQWIYTKAYNVPPLAYSSSEKICKQSWHYVRLYVFAEKTHVESLKDHTICQLFTLHQPSRTTQSVEYECVEFAYNHTLPESALRILLVAMYVWTDSKIDSKEITAIPEFAGEVAAGWQQRVHRPDSPSPFTGTADAFLRSTKQPPLWEFSKQLTKGR